MTSDYASLKQRLPDGPWLLCQHLHREQIADWYVLNVSLDIVAEGITEESVARAIIAIPSMLDDLTAPVPGEVARLAERLRHIDGTLLDRQEAAAALQRLAQEIERLKAENSRLHERLEDNHVFELQDGKMVRVELDEPTPYDGILCRDETIKLQDENMDRLRAEVERLTAPVTGEIAALVDALKRLADPVRALGPGMAERTMHYKAAAALQRLAQEVGRSNSQNEIVCGQLAAAMEELAALRSHNTEMREAIKTINAHLTAHPFALGEAMDVIEAILSRQNQRTNPMPVSEEEVAAAAFDTAGDPLWTQAGVALFSERMKARMTLIRRHLEAAAKVRETKALSGEEKSE